MTTQQTHLLPFYKGWDVYQDLLITSITPLTVEQLSLRAAPHLRSIGENAAHIIGARVGWFHMLMGEGDAEIEAEIPGTFPALRHEAQANWSADWRRHGQ